MSLGDTFGEKAWSLWMVRLGEPRWDGLGLGLVKMKEKHTWAGHISGSANRVWLCTCQFLVNGLIVNI